MRNSNKNLFYFGLFTTGILIFYLSINTEFEKRERIHNYDTHLIEFLGSELATGIYSAKQMESIQKKILSLKQKEYLSQLETENPDAFLKALREIKTSSFGKTYSPNYKYEELQKARDFRNRNGLRVKNLHWISRGPGNVSGRGRSIAVDPSDPSRNTWFLATVGGGVWKTTDAGDTWQNKTPDLLTLSTTSIVIAPSNPNVIYLGTGMGYGRVVDLEGSGIWKSTDHGENWFQLASTANGELLEAINRMVVDPTDENTILVCSNNSYTSIGPNGGNRESGIFRSVDGGNTWIQVFDPDDFFGSINDNRVQQIIADPEDFNTLYASVNEVGVVKSNDGGITWTVSADDFALPGDIGQGEGSYSGVSTRTELAIAPGNTSRIYASVERPFGTAQLYMSKDAGVSWINVRNIGDEINWHSANGNSGADGAYTSGWFNNTIVVHPYDENIVFVGGVNLFRIEVDPDSDTRTIAPIAWRLWPNPYEVPYVHADNHLLTAIPDDNDQSFRIVCPNDGGLAYSEDGGTSWVQKMGMVSTQFYGVDKKPGESAYIGGTQDNGTWISTANPDNQSEWEHVIGGDGFETVWNYNDPDLLLGTSQNGVLSKSEDGGINWSTVTEARGSGGPFISKIANIKTDPDLVYTVTYNGLNRSDNFGDNWDLQTLNPWIGYRPFSNVKISIANPQIVWACSRFTMDVLGNTGGIHVSRDGGFTFEDVTSNMPSGLQEASGLATHPLLESTAFLLFSAPGLPKILRTDDYGQTWEDISGFSSPSARTSPSGFPDVAVFSLLIMPFDPDILWAGTEIGLFISEDCGATWTLADNGFPMVSIFDMKIVDQEVVVGTYGRGIWTAEIPELENYQLPAPVLSPRLSELALTPSGNVRLKADLRSAYDSVHILIDDLVKARIASNESNTDTLIFLPVTEETTISARVLGYKEGNIYKSSTLEEDVFITSPMDSYINLFNQPNAGNDFIGEGFSVRTESGFSSPAIHSPHPYPDQSELIYQLIIPIRVKNENAFFRYKDVVLVEEGESETYTNASFYDFVIVEGTRDGVEWMALAPGYDSRSNDDWSSAYNNSGSGDESLYVQQEIDLKQSFDADELIFVRFRLQSDPLANGWGWAIDNIIIQDEEVTAVENTVEEGVTIFPNPTTGPLNITTSGTGVRKIDILSLDGKLLMSKIIMLNRYSHQLDVSVLKEGLYILHVHTGDGIRKTRFIKEE